MKHKKREHLRNNEFKKAQSVNQRLGREKLQKKSKFAALHGHGQPPIEGEDDLVEKLNLTPDKLHQLKSMQKVHELGGNLYFELNKISFHNDQKRRQEKVSNIHDYTSNSPLKSFTLNYDHER